MDEAIDTTEARQQETKEQKFHRLAERRVNNALTQIRLIGNLSSPQYVCSAEDVEKIVVALQAGIAEIEEQFQKVLDKQKQKFSFE